MCAEAERKYFENMCTTKEIKKEKFKLKKLRLEKMSATFHFVSQSLRQTVKSDICPTDRQKRHEPVRLPRHISQSNKSAKTNISCQLFSQTGFQDRKQTNSHSVSWSVRLSKQISDSLSGREHEKRGISLPFSQTDC
jgi:outer membrane usher protein FimD/PapC